MRYDDDDLHDDDDEDDNGDYDDGDRPGSHAPLLPTDLADHDPHHAYYPLQPYHCHVFRYLFC